MSLKNAAVVCLISLFSATLVMLIARTLDLQTASRLEPHLIGIAEELRALRKQVGGPSSPGASATSAAGDAKAEAAGDGLTVYYFHSNTRCPTCQSIESQARDAVQSEFGPQLARGEIVWKILNYEQPAVAALQKKFDVQVPVVVLAKIQEGEIRDWKRLDEVWTLESDKPGFRKFVCGEIQAMLAGDKGAAPAATKAEMPLPVPTPQADLPPVPEPKKDDVKSGDSKKVSDLPVP